MSRRLRIKFPGAFYHIISRGNRKELIFIVENDYKNFLKFLARTVKKYSLVCYSYCLMPNHYHLLIETPKGNISESMHYLNGLYAQKFNSNHEKIGHVFHGRFKSILVEKNSYFRSLCRYIVRNPIRANLVKKPELYRWSSYPAIAGYSPPESFLAIDKVLSHFYHDKIRAQKAYIRFVNIKSTDERELQAKENTHPILGSEDFIEKCLETMLKERKHKMISKKELRAIRPSLDKIINEEALLDKQEQKKAILAAREKYGYTLKEIATFLRVHYTTITGIIHEST